MQSEIYKMYINLVYFVIQELHAVCIVSDIYWSWVRAPIGSNQRL